MLSIERENRECTYVSLGWLWTAAVLLPYTVCLALFWSDYAAAYESCDVPVDARIVSNGEDQKYAALCHVTLQWTFEARAYSRTFDLSITDAFYDALCEEKADDGNRHVKGCLKSRRPDRLFWGDNMRETVDARRTYHLLVKAIVTTIVPPLIWSLGCALLWKMYVRYDDKDDYTRV